MVLQSGVDAGSVPPPPPPLEWGAGTASSSWREGAITRIHELDSLRNWLKSQAPTSAADDGVNAAISNHLQAALQAACEDHHPWRQVSGAIFERINSNCDAAEADLLRMANDEYILGQFYGLVAHVQRHLPATDSRRRGVEQLAGKLEQQKVTKEPATFLSSVDRTQLIGAVRAASSQAGREQSAVRSFRNLLAVTTVVLFLLAVTVAIVGFVSPTSIPLCFNPEQGGEQLVVCPTGQSPLLSVPGERDIDDVVDETVRGADLFTVEFIGLIAAAISAASGLRRLRGSSLPYGLPVALAVLKLPTGALTAFVGLLLMRGQFVPGLSALDTAAQILAWAALFGYAQQLFTRLVDQQANAVMDRVRGAKHQDAAEPGSTSQ
jgi:hypothetical protein